jgi:short-subunit dehydrogenase
MSRHFGSLLSVFQDGARKATWARAVVTGASSGIGEAFARELAARGTELVVVARRTELLRGLAEELGTRFEVDVEVLSADLTVSQDVDRVASRLLSPNHPVDLLVNNAGGSTGTGRGRFVDHSVDDLMSQAYLNAISVMRLTHAATRVMSERRSGNVIQVSAGTAFYPVPYGAVYGASKAFVNSVSEAVNYELKGSGITITAVCPGFTRTSAPGRIGFTEDNIPGWWWSDPEDVVAAALRAASAGKAICTPGWVNRFNAIFGRVFPRTMMRSSARVTARP